MPRSSTMKAKASFNKIGNAQEHAMKSQLHICNMGHRR